MDTFPVTALDPEKFPPLLAEIPQPPRSLWVAGQLPPNDLHLLAVVGSRSFTSYGRQAIEALVGGLAAYRIGIISGLALGIDALAHETALKHNLYTMAVPGSGLDPSVLYPATNRRLARRILDAGGGLLSELPPDTRAAKWTFPQRNRIMAGMCHATLLIEAGEKSGTLITARMAVDYNRELLAVPGNIFSTQSYGTNQFIKLGATPVTEPTDIVAALGLTEIETPQPAPPLAPAEIQVLTILETPTDRDTLIRALGIPVHEAHILLMHMEIAGYIMLAGNQYSRSITTQRFDSSTKS